MDRSGLAAFGGGAVIGALGGLIGLGGAEFRLPLLIGSFRFAALEAVILNKAMSLVVVAAALVFRTRIISIETVASHGDIILNILAGSMAGAWFGAGWAMRLKSEGLHRIIAVLLVVIAWALLFGHDAAGQGQPLFAGSILIGAGVLAGFAIGIVASLLGVAGGELLIPALVLLFGLDIKLAGSLSLAISLPTMIVGFSRYTQDASFAVLGSNRTFMAVMAAGSLLGAFIGGMALGLVPSTILLPLLSGILMVSAIRIWQHG